MTCWQCDDLIIVHSIRPENMFSQVKSFVDNQIEFVNHKKEPLLKNMATSLKIRNQLFLFISDNEDMHFNKIYLKELSRTKKYILKNKLNEKIKIDYWSFERQNVFFDYLFTNFPQAKQIKSLFSDYSSKKFGGLRGIQNKGLIIADYVSKDINKNMIYHKLDDDIYSYIASFKDGILKFTQGYNVFDHKSKLLNEKGIRIIGSIYSIDSASPLIDLKEGLKEMLYFLNGIDKEKINIFSRMSMIPKKIIDESQIIKNKTPILTPNSKLKDIDKLVDFLKMGNNRFIFHNIENISNNFFRFVDTIPGGCVSFKKYEKIFPMINGSNQDVLFSVLEHAKRGGIHTDLPIGHIKSITNRGQLLESLKIGQAFGKKTNDFHTMNNILKLAKKDGFMIGKGLDNGGFYNWRFHNIKPEGSNKIINDILKITKNLNKNETISKIEIFARHVKKNMNEMSKSFDYDKRNVAKSKLIAKKLYNNWKNSIYYFFELRKIVSRIENKF